MMKLLPITITLLLIGSFIYTSNAYLTKELDKAHDFVEATMKAVASDSKGLSLIKIVQKVETEEKFFKTLLESWYKVIVDNSKECKNAKVVTKHADLVTKAIVGAVMDEFDTAEKQYATASKATKAVANDVFTKIYDLACDGEELLGGVRNNYIKKFTASTSALIKLLAPESKEKVEHWDNAYDPENPGYFFTTDGVLLSDSETCVPKSSAKGLKNVEDVCKDQPVCRQVMKECGNGFCTFEMGCIKQEVCEDVYDKKKKKTVEKCEDTYSCMSSDIYSIDEMFLNKKCVKTYKVTKKDTMESILKKFKLTEMTFEFMNAGVTKVSAGDKVCVSLEVNYKRAKCGKGECDAGYQCVEKTVCEKAAISPYKTCGQDKCSDSEVCKVITEKYA